MSHLPPIHHPPSTPLSIGDVVFIKIGTARLNYLKQLFTTYKHLNCIETLKHFALSDKVAKIKDSNEYFFIDPNLMGYIMSECIDVDEAEKRNYKIEYRGPFFGYLVRWEMLNKKMISVQKETFIYEKVLLPISDIVILGAEELYEEIMRERPR